MKWLFQWKINPQKNPGFTELNIPVWRVAFTSATFMLFVILMLTQWWSLPNSSPLLGPLWFVWYGDPQNVILTLILLPALFAFPMKPHIGTLLLSVLTALAWWTLGVIGQATGC